MYGKYGSALLVAPVQPATAQHDVPVAGAAVAAAVEAALFGREATHDGFLVERRPPASLGDGYHALSCRLFGVWESLCGDVCVWKLKCDDHQFSVFSWVTTVATESCTDG